MRKRIPCARTSLFGHRGVASDCIIADYNYVFDPRYLRRFYASGQKHDYVFLIDEAHNLTDRAGDVFRGLRTASADAKVA